MFVPDPSNPKQMIHISVGGPDREIIDANGKRWRFEMHHYFGPNLVNKRGDLIDNPGPRSAFWHAVEAWARQGERIGPDGLCVWDPPKRERIYRIDRRNAILVPDEVPDDKIDEWGLAFVLGKIANL